MYSSSVCGTPGVGKAEALRVTMDDARVGRWGWGKCDGWECVFNEG